MLLYWHVELLIAYWRVAPYMLLQPFRLLTADAHAHHVPLLL